MDQRDFTKGCVKTESRKFDEILERISFSKCLSEDKKKFSEETIRLLHVAFGLVTEAGEFADTIKKYIFYGKKIDRTNMVEEIGDLLYYIAIFCDIFETDFEKIMELNNKKLQSRYGEKFSREKALNRDLEEEKKILSKG
jgi:NTP pyrophosphatase (non-canonical NTP hydrolase)